MISRANVGPRTIEEIVVTSRVGSLREYLSGCNRFEILTLQAFSKCKKCTENDSFHERSKRRGLTNVHCSCRRQTYFTTNKHDQNRYFDHGQNKMVIQYLQPVLFGSVKMPSYSSVRQSAFARDPSGLSIQRSFA